jgi:hypothetical protein
MYGFDVKRSPDGARRSRGRTGAIRLDLPVFWRIAAVYYD